MTKVVVTGGAGFIGSHIVDALLSKGMEVVVVDDFSTGKKENLAHVKGKVTLLEGSITDADLMRRACTGARAVIHLAALPSVPKSIELPMETNLVNEVGTLTVFLAARDAGIDRVIYASSSSVYGDTPTLPKVETMPPSPLSPYAVQKLTAELYGRIFTSLYGLKTIGLRYFNIFGPRQDPHSMYSAVIPKFIHLMKQGQAPVINGDGEHTRDFTYIDNVVEANMRALETMQGFGEAYNIAAGDRISLNRLVDEINGILGTHTVAEHGAPRQGDIKDSFADIEKAKAAFGYEPGVSFRDGLARTVDAIV